MIDTAIKYANEIGAELRRLGAQGNDLHRMLTSVEHQLPAPLVDKLRFVIAIRNKVMHPEEAVDVSHDDYERACRAALGSLRQIRFKVEPAGSSHPLFAIFVRASVTILAAALSIVAFLVVERRFALDTLESWGLPILAFVVLSVQAQASRARHWMFDQGGAKPVARATTWFLVSVGLVALAVYLYQPKMDLLSTATAAVGLSVLVHGVIGIDQPWTPFFDRLPLVPKCYHDPSGAGPVAKPVGIGADTAAFGDFCS